MYRASVWDTNMHIEGTTREKWEERLLEEIMAKFFPKLMKIINVYFQEA